MARAAPLSLDITEPHDFEPEPQDWSKLTLDEIGRAYGTDKSSLDHGYLVIYEQYLRHLRDKPINLLEIGVACGASLKMWARFMPSALITGVDVRLECADLCGDYPKIGIKIADATKTSIFGSWDIIIDDGSHVSADIVDAFKLHWQMLKPGGYYIVEDMRCTSRPEYRNEMAFVVPEERFDRAYINGWLGEIFKAMDWGQEVACVHGWPQLVIIKKL